MDIFPKGLRFEFIKHYRNENKMLKMKNWGQRKTKNENIWKHNVCIDFEIMQLSLRIDDGAQQ